MNENISTRFGDDISERYNLISLFSSEINPFEVLRALMWYETWNIVIEFFIYLRNFERGFEFISRCRQLMSLYKEDITAREYKSWDFKLTGLHLVLLDRLNRWEDYLKTYECEYERLMKIPFYSSDPQNHGALMVIKKGLPQPVEVRDTDFEIYCASVDRYWVIMRKLGRKKAGKSIEHLKCHPQSKLSEEELKHRFNYLIRLLNSQMGLNYPTEL